MGLLTAILIIASTAATFTDAAVRRRHEDIDLAESIDGQPPTHWLPAQWSNDRIISEIESTEEIRARRQSGGDSCPPRAARGDTAPHGFRLELISPAGVRRGSCAPLGQPLRVRITTSDKYGAPHCRGGDFFEAELVGPRFKGRPMTVDNRDGTYTLDTTVPADRALEGRYLFRVTLLFTRYAGMTMRRGWRAGAHFKRPLTLRLDLRLSCGGANADEGPPLLLGGASCAHNVSRVYGGFGARAAEWHGFWIQPPGGKCNPPYCVGDNDGALGSRAEGWVYRLPACYFELLGTVAARQCLGGAWVHMLGDSNHQDTARNLAHAVLHVTTVKRGHEIPRTFDMMVRWSPGPRGAMRVSNVFNGHPRMLGNNVGLRSYDVDEFRARTRRSLTPAASGLGSRGPDAIIMNSGLHDALVGMPGGVWSPRAFDGVLRRALPFLASLVNGTAASHQSRGPRLRGPNGRALSVWRSTVAPAGVKNRRLALNPQKVEVMNRLTANVWHSMLGGDGFSANALVNFIDEYDMTFPWHW